MKQERYFIKIIIISSIFFLIPAIASADKTDKLIQLLINKKIVTADEAKSLVDELEDNAKAKNDFKIVKATTASSDGAENVKVKYDKCAVIKTTDNNFSLKFNFRFHGLFSYENPDNGATQSTFSVRRARILASGNAFFPWLKYGTQITLEGSNVAMRDAYMEVSYFKWMILRIGQYKVPFDREFLNGGFNLQLIDRSIASSIFSLQRDIGLQVSGKRILDTFDYSVGVFNGSGANQNNVDNDYMYVGRLVWSPFGSYPYWESAVDEPPTPKYALGLAGAYMPGLESEERTILAGQLGNSSIVPVESDVTQWTADFAYKYQNFSFMSGYHYRNIKPKALSTFEEQDAWGIYFQSGYFLVPGKFEIAGRYAFVEPDNPGLITDNKETELTFGFNYYFQGHKMKTGINYSLFSMEKLPGDEEEHAVKASVIMQF